MVSRGNFSIKIAIRFLAGLCLIQALAGAQDFECKVEIRGRSGRIVTIKTQQTSALEILSALAAGSGYGLRFSSAELTDRIDQIPLDLNLKQISLADMLLPLGGAIGIHAEVDFNEKLIRVVDLPPTSAKNASAFYHARALKAVTDAYADSKSGELDLLLQSADLHLTAREYGKALEAFAAFFKDKDDEAKKHPQAIEACLRAGRCALAINAPEEAWKYYDYFVQNFPRNSRLPDAHLMGAESRVLAGSWAEAIRILRALERAGTKREIDERDALLAEMMLAETYWRIKEYDRALLILDQAKDRHTHLHADLIGQMPLYAGLCRRAKGEVRKSVYDFRVAAVTCPNNELRRRAVREQADTLLQLDAPFEALAAVRISLQMEPDGPELLKLRLIEAAAFRGLGLNEKALDLLEQTALQLEELSSSIDHRRVSAISLMNAIAEIRFERREFSEAAAFFATIEEYSDLKRHAAFMRARCHFAAGKWAQALAVTDRLGSVGDDQVLALEVRQLRGDCFMKLGLFERAIKNYRDA
ncbi:MAG: hypothetical protein V3W41_03835 [Planctomycetota bacterium]